MEYLNVFLITQAIFLCLQYIYYFKLEHFQYYELLFGSFFIIVFFGIFGSFLTLENLKTEPKVFFNSVVAAILFSIWFYITKKLSNILNSDNNGVVDF